MLQWKRKVVLSIVSTVTILQLSACSGTKPASPENSSKPETTESTNAEKSTAPEKRGKVTATIYDRGLIAASEGTIEDNRWTKWINENGPSDVTYMAIPRSESKQKINTLFASGSAPDVIFEYDPMIKNPLFEQKQLMPLDEMIEQYSTVYKRLIEQTPALKTAGMKSDGKIYEFGKVNETMPQNIVVIRKDWLEKLKLKEPTTTEELYEIARAFALDDPDDNQKKDTYGINVGYVLPQMFGLGYITFGSNNTTELGNSYRIENDGLVRNWENLYEFTSFTKRLFDEGIIDKDFVTDTNFAKARQDFLEGKIGIYSVQANSYQLWTRLWIDDYNTLKSKVPEAELTVMQVPESPRGQYVPSIANPLQMTAVVNRSAKDPEAVMKYIDFLSSQEAGITLTRGIEGEHWNKKENGCPSAIDAEKNKTEIGYLGGDFVMVNSILETGECLYIASNYDDSNPSEKFAKEMYRKNMDQFYDLIFNKQAQYPELTHGEHFPTVPKDLLVDSQSGLTEIKNLITKAIVSGASYTPEKAIEDAKKAWSKFNGDKIDEFYNNWYKTSKDTAFLPDDMFQIVKDQRAVQDKLMP